MLMRSGAILTLTWPPARPFNSCTVTVAVAVPACQEIIASLADIAPILQESLVLQWVAKQITLQRHTVRAG